MTWECVSDEMAEVFRQMTPRQKLDILDGMWRSARKMIYLQLKREHPEWEEDQLQLETSRRISHGAF